MKLLIIICGKLVLYINFCVHILETVTCCTTIREILNSRHLRMHGVFSYWHAVKLFLYNIRNPGLSIIVSL